MKYIKIIFTVLALWSLNGCMSSKSYYVLSIASQPQSIYASKKKVIGVEKVVVPHYLYKREIAVAETANKITLRNNALWGEDLDDGLTQRLISFLQKKFNQPQVYGYPWGIDRLPHVKVSVHITRFIAQGKYVYLDANWEVVNMQTQKRKARLFTTKVSTATDANSIVLAMDKAFSKLEEAIALGIK